MLRRPVHQGGGADMTYHNWIAGEQGLFGFDLLLKVIIEILV
jgi:hypothetical protein